MVLLRPSQHIWVSELVGVWGWAHEFPETRISRLTRPSHSFWSSRNGFNGFIKTLSAFWASELVGAWGWAYESLEI